MKSCYRCGSHNMVRRVEVPDDFETEGWLKRPDNSPLGGRIVRLCKDCREVVK